MLRALGIILTALVLYWTLLFFVQRTLIYPRPALANVPSRPADAEQVWLDLPAGRTEAWLLPARGPAPGPAPVLLFAHGNAELIDHWAAEFDEPRAWGLAVLLVEYPGYGRSAGVPTQTTIAEAMAAAHDWIATRPSLDPNRIIAYGRSLGGGAVSTLIPERRPAALILESAFTDTRRFARSVGAPGLLVRDQFDNRAALLAYHGPVLLLHGEHDDIVPIAHGEALAAVAGVELRRMPCGHNDCARAWGVMREFLAEHALLPD
ncbi:MAG TPA: prolyl oligopeptidase family serine peptidase [Gemmatimonadales bacterium]|nr:prolyl oligopeptidase family serine peptidase [Gemmatimonadales bacterium]